MVCFHVRVWKLRMRGPLSRSARRWPVSCCKLNANRDYQADAWSSGNGINCRATAIAGRCNANSSDDRFRDPELLSLYSMEPIGTDASRMLLARTSKPATSPHCCQQQQQKPAITERRPAPVHPALCGVLAHLAMNANGHAASVMQLQLLLLPALLVLLCTPYAAAQSSSVPATSASVQISPAILLIGKFDWQIDAASSPNAPWSRCLDMVWRAASAGSDRLNFVPTHHWLPGEDGAAGNQISGFCYMHQNDGGGNTCTPFDDATINEFRNAMTICFTEALKQGFTLYVRPHLDDGTASGAWRNGLLLQPSTKYNGYSYYDIMLAPLADALKAALANTAAEGTLRAMPGKNRPTVYLGMQGEMSATVMRFASQWGMLVQGLKDRVGADHADVKIGIGLNFNRLDDVTSVSKTYDSSRLSWLMWQLGAEPTGDVPPIDGDGLMDLLNNKLDFVGISAYAPYTGRGFDSSEFENSAYMFGDEMRNKYGIDIPSLINSGKLELQYSEFGLGGGANYAGNQPAQSPGEVALRPFFGIYGLYNSATDPWNMGDNRAYLREFYSKAILWLSRSDNKTYKLSSVFIWCMASWDVLAIYPEDTTSSGSYRDTQVADAVADYNRAVVRAQGGAPLGGASGGQQFVAAVGK